MRLLRIICILAVVVGLVLMSVGSVFAGSSSVPAPGALGQERPAAVVGWRAFFGNVTAVSDGNITLQTKDSGPVNLALTTPASYRIIGEIGLWFSLDKFKEALGGNLSSLLGDRVVVLARNVSGAVPQLSGDVVSLLVIPSLKTLLHVHRTGNVTEYNTGTSITIVDIHGVRHTSAIDTNTRYYPAGIKDTDIKVGSFVTVVSTVNTAIAKAIVLYPTNPARWPTPAP